ncbi:MAG: MFS transporter, partial [Gluconacetobacter diazotrophicus]|nr:MFS transporter [Gluconacetobacter diazotrophicus]
MNTTTAEPSLPRWLPWLLACTAGATVANIYYCQPLLDAMAASFGVGVEAVSNAAATTQLGVAVGMLSIVPLGDSHERKRLIVLVTAVSAVTLAATALCRSVVMLGVAGFATGAFGVAQHLVVPYAAGTVGPERRGQTVGFVMSGLLLGVLLSRTFSGIVGAHRGWRAVYWLAAGAMLALASLLAAVLPSQRPARRVPYGELLRSLWPLLLREPVLRRHAFIGAVGMGAFSAFWTTLAFFLAALPGHYGSETAGVFGLVGAAGAAAAVVSGRLADRVGPRPLNGTALGLIIASFGLMAVAGRSLGWLAVGVVVMDAGVQASHISNQTRVYGLSGELRNRLNAIYMVCYFLGGAVGSTLGSRAWVAYGWPGVCATGAAFGAAGLVALFAVAHP